jgi:hypothetical protein
MLNRSSLTGPYGDFRDHLQSQGFAVIKNALDPEKAKYYQQKALDWLTSFGTPLGLDDPSTWTADNIPRDDPSEYLQRVFSRT